jgi:glycosyltransferase involved in cell wall biosynthesis
MPTTDARDRRFRASPERQPLVDVIIPSYNYGRYLGSAVESVLRDGVPCRILIIDDCSTDDTLEIGPALERAHPEVEYRRHETNKGHINTYNEGIEWCQSLYMVLLSADDLLAPGALSRAVECFQRYPGVVLVYGETLTFDTTPPAVTAPADVSCSVVTAQEFVAAACRTAVNPIASPASVVVRTGVQRAAGGYLRSLPHAGDLEMWLRLASYGQVARLGAVQGFYRQHVSNMSKGYYRQPISDFVQRWDAFEAFFNSHGHRLLDGVRLREETTKTFARMAVRQAERDWQESRPQGTSSYLRFARRIRPEITKERSWRRLRLKRVFGPALTARLSAFADAARGSIRLRLSH